MYIGKVGERFFDQKSAEWREEQRDILRAMDQHQAANESYMEESVALLELVSPITAAIQNALITVFSHLRFRK